MIYCKYCVLPNTKPGIIFDEFGVCSACRAVEKKEHIDWDQRAEKLKQICDDIRGSNGNGYDCVVPVSGGKDSMYQVYILSQVHKLKVLVVTVMAHLQTPEGVKNLKNVRAVSPSDLTVYDILRYESLVILKEQVERVNELWA